MLGLLNFNYIPSKLQQRPFNLNLDKILLINQKFCSETVITTLPTLFNNFIRSFVSNNYSHDRIKSYRLRYQVLINKKIYI